MHTQRILQLCLTLLALLGSMFLIRHAQAQPDSGDDRKLAIYIIGDSTVRNGQGEQVGWGEVIGTYFDQDKITIHNRAIGGRSTRTYLREGRWRQVLEQLQPGDIVIMQFGHNDGGRVGDPRFKRRPALPGIGDETQDVTLDDGSVETVHTYGWYLQKFCREAIQAGATPIVCSPVPHKDNWRDGQFVADFVDHRAWANRSAELSGARFINLTLIVGEQYQALGPDAVEGLFADARTHTNQRGAEVNAACVVAGLRALEIASLDASFSRQARSISPARAHVAPRAVE